MTERVAHAAQHFAGQRPAAHCNRTIEEWIPLFDDPILTQSALDRLAHDAYQVVMEGESYRKRLRPGVATTRPRAPRARPRQTRKQRKV